MKTLIVCIALLAPSLAFADGFGYQDDTSVPADGYSGYGYQAPPDWTPPPPPQYSPIPEPDGYCTNC